MNTHQDQDKAGKARQQRVIHEALAPFEDNLIAQLPTIEQMVERAAERQRKNKQRLKGTAFTILISTLATAFWLDPAYMTYSEMTAIGKQTDLQLSDGSTIQLNTDTKVTITMHLRSRRISLAQGEATFHVAHSWWHQYLPRAERPFIVQAGNIQIRDIGTIFNVRLTPENQTHITVVEGRVLVSENDNIQNSKHIELKIGQAIYSKNGALQQIQYVDPQQITAWQQGRIYFYNQTLTEVFHELNRYGQLPVIIKDQKTAQIRISAQVDMHHREQFVQLLSGFAPVIVKQNKDGTQLIQSQN